MPSLHELQSAVRHSLLDEADGGAAAFIIGAGLTPDARLGIYRNTMRGTFSNALRLSFPAVHRLVGADFFDQAAQIFGREQPPRRADLNTYGADFPDFLGSFKPAASLTYLSDVARLEWAVNRAQHASDAAALDLTQLGRVASGDQDRICFIPHPSITLLRSSYPVDAIWRAVLEQDDAALHRINPDSGSAFLLVQRLADQLEVMPLSAEVWHFSDALLSGQPLGVALDSACGIDAPALLAQHLAAGRCVGFHLVDAPFGSIAP
jgi:hypothetical protein